MSNNERDVRMLLAGVEGLGPITLREMERELGDLERVLEWGEEAWVRQLGEQRGVGVYRDLKKKSIEEEKIWLEKHGARFLTEDEEAFPRRLKELRDCPLGLYMKGDPENWIEPGVAIVGTREPTHYGLQMARILASDLAERGVNVISGLARGIDAEVHRAVLRQGGVTTAVLGSGLNRLYPSSHHELMKEVAASGGVWTEFAVNRRADRQSFPQRNRIVAGMASAVVVVESGLHGGSMITARFAGEQGRHVYAVPGRVDSPVSEGCHELIRDGVTLVRTADDILEDLEYLPLELVQVNGRNSASRIPEPVCPYAAEEKGIWEYLQKTGPAYPDQISEGQSRSVSEINTLLIKMEMSGYILKNWDGTYEAAWGDVRGGM